MSSQESKNSPERKAEWALFHAHNKSGTARNKALGKKIGDDRQTSTKHETAEGQKKNAALRKGMKRPEHGPWPIAK